MRTSLLLLACASSASADPCTAAELRLAKVTELAPRVVGTTCTIRSVDGRIDKERLHKTFAQVPVPGDPNYGSDELTVAVAIAKELAAAITCEGALPAIDFIKDRAWVIVRDRLRSGSTELVRGFDDGHTLVLADRTRAGCPGGARYTFDRYLVTTIVVAPADRSLERRVCYVPEPPCRENAK